MASKHLTKEQQNYVCFSVVCVNFIKLPLIEILKCKVPPVLLYHEIKLSSTLTTGKNKLRQDQLNICFLSPPNTPDYSKFDVTLLYTLIRNLCPSLMPTKGWGNEPEATDRKIGDDIERLRLFRNTLAHRESANIRNDEFIDLWKKLDSVIKRVKHFLIQNGSSTVMDFEQELRNIERCNFGYEDMENYKLMLEAMIQISKHKSDDEPEISIKDVGEVICGGTVRLEAEVMQTHHSHWLITWHKVRGSGLDEIDTTSEKYRGSDNRHLVIQSVCKEDEGEYRAILSLHMERKDISIYSNTVAVHALGECPVITCVHATCNMKDQTVTLNSEIYVYDKSPEVHEVFWTKNREVLDIPGRRGKYTLKSIQEPSLTIHNVNYIDAGSYKLTAVNAVGATDSEVIELGVPDISLVRLERSDDGRQWFTMAIKSTPSPCFVQWSAKEKSGDMYRPIDIYAEEYKGTSIILPHPVLVVNRNSLLDNHSFQIEVKNVIGSCRKSFPDDTISGIPKSDTIKVGSLGRFYTERGASVKFARVFEELAEGFPSSKIKNLKDIIKNSLTFENTTSLAQADSARDCFGILRDENLFTSSNMIFMQYLLKMTDCDELFKICFEYAEAQNALCFFETKVNGFKKVEFHIQGDLLAYSKEQIESILETVAVILQCGKKEIIVNGLRQANSFFIVLSIKEMYMKKLLNLNESGRDELQKQNIDYFIIDKTLVSLKRKKESDVTLESLPRFWDYTSHFIMDPHGEFVLQYLGSTTLAKATSSGLGTIQKPLRDSYFEYRKHSGKKHKSKDLTEVALQITPNGIAVIVAGVSPGSELFYDMQSISFFEAVRFTTVKGHDKKIQGGFVPIDINRAPNTGSEKLFTPLDKKHSNLSKVDHPPLLALVMRRNSGVRALECHGFVCDNEDQALRITQLIYMLQTRMMEPGRPEYMRQPSDPNYEREPPHVRRPDILQTTEGQRPMQLTDEYLRGSRTGEWEDYRPEFEGQGHDRYMRDPYGPPGGPRDPQGYMPASGRFDNRFPTPGYDENIRHRHEREHSGDYQRPPSNEFHHERQHSNEMRRDRPPPDYRYERQPSMEYRHERQRSNELAHERKQSGEFRHERQPSAEYHHERQGSGDYPRGDGRYPREGYDSGGRRGRPENRQEDFRIPRVMSPGRVPPATAPKPSRALSPGPRSPMEDRYLGNEPPGVKRGLPRTPSVDEPPIHSPTRDRPPSFKGPEYSASSLESRQEIEQQRSKPVARVPPHLVAGVKVLPTGFAAAIQKKQEEKKSPRSPKQERYAEEDPYDNAMTRKEFYEHESKKFDHNSNAHAPPDIVPRVDHGREEDYNDYDRVIRRDPEGYYPKGPANFRHSAPSEDLGKPHKPWSYDEQFQKYSQEKDRFDPSYDTSRDPLDGPPDHRHGEMAEMFNKMNIHNPSSRAEVPETNFEQSLGYYP